MDTKAFAHIITRYRKNKDVSNELQPYGISTDQLRRLLEAWLRIYNCRGGETDWGGGGNPHRAMEEMERNSANAAFDRLCQELGLSPSEVSGAVYDSHREKSLNFNGWEYTL